MGWCGFLKTFHSSLWTEMVWVNVLLYSWASAVPALYLGLPTEKEENASHLTVELGISVQAFSESNEPR